MTILAARTPLQILSMSAMQVGSRRLSARLQEKDDAQSKLNGTSSNGPASKESGKRQSSGTAASRKRKNDYDEDDDGFVFSRVKSKKPRQSRQDAKPHAEDIPSARPTRASSPDKRATSIQNAAETRGNAPRPAPKGKADPKKSKRMSFSTPKAKEQPEVRRSKRLSSERPGENGSPTTNTSPIQPRSKKKIKAKHDERKLENGDEVGSKPSTEEPARPVVSDLDTDTSTTATHPGTKIALPFADTPVNRRNKAMRKEKSMKGDRRSSLASRGQRASSLFETGNSYALPHQELEVADFYKHIGSGLMEPRRMQQLLTWCASRAMHAKPMGTDFEDSSAKSAARIIEEELLKELSDRPEMSNWFDREDVSEPVKPLPERPNPKNIQNVQKITELEQQIQRLKEEKDALQSLLQPPKLEEINAFDSRITIADVDRNLLSDDDRAILDTINSCALFPEDISGRINMIGSKLGQQIDTFADTIHKVAQYRTATDNIAGRILSKCANSLAERERVARRKALHVDDDRSPGRDLSGILRGLSKADR